MKDRVFFQKAAFRAPPEKGMERANSASLSEKEGEGTTPPKGGERHQRHPQPRGVMVENDTSPRMKGESSTGQVEKKHSESVVSWCLPLLSPVGHCCFGWCCCLPLSLWVVLLSHRLSSGWCCFRLLFRVVLPFSSVCFVNNN